MTTSNVSSYGQICPVENHSLKQCRLQLPVLGANLQSLHSQLPHPSVPALTHTGCSEKGDWGYLLKTQANIDLGPLAINTFTHQADSQRTTANSNATLGPICLPPNPRESHTIGLSLVLDDLVLVTIVFLPPEPEDLLKIMISP